MCLTLIFETQKGSAGKSQCASAGPKYGQSSNTQHCTQTSSVKAIPDLFIAAQASFIPICLLLLVQEERDHNPFRHLSALKKHTHTHTLCHTI